VNTIAELIADPARRCKYDVALDRDGRPVDPESDDAVAFCIQGAFMRAYPDVSMYGFERGNGGLWNKVVAIIHEDVCTVSFWSTVCGFNNTTDDHAKVLEVARAIDDHVASIRTNEEE
jgi:hypothetical protein